MSFCGLRPPRGAVTFPRSHSQCGEEPDCHLLSPLLTSVFSAETEAQPCVQESVLQRRHVGSVATVESSSAW